MDGGGGGVDLNGGCWMTDADGSGGAGGGLGALFAGGRGAAVGGIEGTDRCPGTIGGANEGGDGATG